jgi:hypothetical protein
VVSATRPITTNVNPKRDTTHYLKVGASVS